MSFLVGRENSSIISPLRNISKKKILFSKRNFSFYFRMFYSTLCFCSLNLSLFLPVWSVFVFHYTISTIPINLSGTCPLSCTDLAYTMPDVLPVSLRSCLQFSLLSVFYRPHQLSGATIGEPICY